MAVDDDPMVLNLIGRCLKIYGATPILCDNAYDGIRETKNHLPDVILLDLIMNGRDGFAFLRDLRELGPGRGSDTAVVIVTGVRHPEVEAAARKAGAGYLSKPFTPATLVNAITEALNRFAGFKSNPDDTDHPVQTKWPALQRSHANNRVLTRPTCRQRPLGGW